MAINLAKGYGKNIASAFSGASFVKGNTSEGYDFTGVKGLAIYTPQTVAMSDYQRSGANRYGTPVEMEDTIQELIMEKDRSFSLTIDKGNNSEQMLTKNAGAMLKLQLQERVAPEVDAYALKKFINFAGKVAVAATAPTKTTAVEAIFDGIEALDNAHTPQDNRFVYMTSAMYKFVKLSPEFLGLESLGEKALAKGIVGEIGGVKIIKVPATVMPTGCHFVMAHKDAVILPYKIEDAKIHMDPPGINGALLEGRNLFDAFVIGARCDGVYAFVDTAYKLADPAISRTNDGQPVSIVCTGADKILYTLDGTDPRFSPTARVYSGTIALSDYDGNAIKAAAFASAKFTSNVATKIY